MIDLNAHVLPAIDDGPETEDDAYALIQQAAQDGIEAVVAAAHANDGHFATDLDTYQQVFSRTQEWIKRSGIPLHLVPGMVVRISPGIVEAFREGRYLGIGGSGYVSLELPANDVPVDTFDIVERLMSDGHRVLLIHPERCRALRLKQDLRQRLLAMTVVGVAASGSLLGQFGAEVEAAAMDLIDIGLIQSVASDGHSLVKRPLRLSPVRELLSRRYGEPDADWMVQAVPGMVLAGREVELRPRQCLGWQRWQSARS